jgi:hypothetical protein
VTGEFTLAILVRRTLEPLVIIDLAEEQSEKVELRKWP